MDLVSFETRQEYDWVKGFIDGGSSASFSFPTCPAPFKGASVEVVFITVIFGASHLGPRNRHIKFFTSLG